MDSLIFLGAKLPFQYVRSVKLAHYCTCFFVADVQFAVVNETQKCLNFPDYFSDTLSTRKEHCFGCLDRHMVSVIVVTIFIPATEHACENL